MQRDYEGLRVVESMDEVPPDRPNPLDFAAHLNRALNRYERADALRILSAVHNEQSRRPRR